ncbi:MAG: hypothetical protein R3B06_25350 [Kofleriaceae bacterium]
MRPVVAALALAATTTAAAADPPPPVTAVTSVTSAGIDARPRGELIAAGLVESIDGVGGSRFELTRAEAGVDLALGAARSSVTIEAVRSAGPGSAVGVDGNSLVARWKHAAVGGRWRRGRIAGGFDLGLVADPWVATAPDYPMRTLGPTQAEALGLIAPSDLGITGQVALGDDLAVHLMVANGEGLTQRERNRGKTTTAVIVGQVPVALGGGVLGGRLYGRDGSVGPGAVRSHRLGGALTWRRAEAAVGVDGLRAWGVAERSDAEATVVTGWADVTVWRQLGLTTRLDRAAITGPADAVVTWRGQGAVWWALAPTARVAVAVSLERARATGAPIPGAAAATDATQALVLVQGALPGVH